MNTISIENLKVINNYSEDYNLIGEGIELSLLKKNEYDSIYAATKLEFPTYFTYHHVLNIIDTNKSLT